MITTVIKHIQVIALEWFYACKSVFNYILHLRKIGLYAVNMPGHKRSYISDNKLINWMICVCMGLVMVTQKVTIARILNPFSLILKFLVVIIEMKWNISKLGVRLQKHVLIYYTLLPKKYISRRNCLLKEICNSAVEVKSVLIWAFNNNAKICLRRCPRQRALSHWSDTY